MSSEYRKDNVLGVPQGLRSTRSTARTKEYTEYRKDKAIEYRKDKAKANEYRKDKAIEYRKDKE